MAYNEKHGIVPQTITKEVRDVLQITPTDRARDENGKALSALERRERIEQLTKEMRHAAKLLEFEHAAWLRDEIEKLKKQK